MDHEKIDLELQLKLSNQPELQGKPEFELRTRATEDENSQLTKKLMKNVSEVRKKINEGDQFEEAEIGDTDVEPAKSTWKNSNSEKPLPTNESSAVETVIPLPPVKNKDIPQVQRSPQKLDVATTILPPSSIPSENPSPTVLPEHKNDDFYQLSHDIVSVKEVISPDKTVIPTSSDATPLTLEREEEIITHGTPIPSTTTSTLSSSEISTTDTIPTFSNLKKTEFNFESSEELESADEEFPLVTTTITSEITRQPTQRVDILTTKGSETLIPADFSTLSPTVSKEIKEQELSASQKSETVPYSTTLVPPTLPVIFIPTIQPTPSYEYFKPTRRILSEADERYELSTLEKIFSGVRCAMKDCKGVLRHNYPEDIEIKDSAGIRFARDHGSVQPTDTPCSCGTEKQKNNNQSTTVPAPANITDMKNVHS